MTINSISTIASTPFTGLGTQTYNVTTTGLYTAQVGITLPWTTGDQPYAVNNPEKNQVQTITAVADSAGSLDSTYWTFYLPGNAPFQVSGTWYSFYYVWYNINSAGTDPAPAGGYGIQVAAATNASASTLGGDTRTQIAAALPTTGNSYSVSGATSACILTALEPGNVTAAADSSGAPTSFTFAVGTTGTYGYASGLVCTVKHNTTTLMVLSQPSPTQPSLSGATQVQCTAGDTITVIMSSLASADAALNAVKGIINVFLGPI